MIEKFLPDGHCDGWETSARLETYLKGEGVDVEELDIADKKDKAARQS